MTENLTDDETSTQASGTTKTGGGGGGLTGFARRKGGACFGLVNVNRLMRSPHYSIQRLTSRGLFAVSSFDLQIIRLT